MRYVEVEINVDVTFMYYQLVEFYFILQVETGLLTEPLWDPTTVPYPYPNNAMFVREYTIKLLSTSFPNMTTAEVFLL